MNEYVICGSPDTGVPLAANDSSAQAGVATPLLRHHVCYSFEDARDFRTAWDGLALDCGDVFCTFDWCETWWRHFGVGRPLEIHTVWEDKRLIAVVPIHRHTLTVAGVPLRTVQLVGCDHALAPAGLSVRPEYAADIARRLVSAASDRGPWDVLHLGPLCSYATVVQKIGRASIGLRAAGLVVLGERDDCSAVYKLPGTYDEYLATMLGPERRNVLRCEHKLHADHDVCVAVAGTPAECEEAVNALIQLHEELWRAKGRLGQFVEWPGFERFYRDAAATQARQGRLLMVTVKADGQIVGAESGYILGSRAHAIIRGYRCDDTWRLYSLGRVLHCGLVREAIRRGAQTLDDGAGVFEYKHRLGAEFQCLQSVTIVRRGVTPRLRVWLATRLTYFSYRVHWIWVNKLRRLGFRRLGLYHERPIK